MLGVKTKCQQRLRARQYFTCSIAEIFCSFSTTAAFEKYQQRTSFNTSCDLGFAQLMKKLSRFCTIDEKVIAVFVQLMAKFALTAESAGSLLLWNGTWKLFFLQSVLNIIRRFWTPWNVSIFFLSQENRPLTRSFLVKRFLKTKVEGGG